MGLWIFSTRLNGAVPYREVAPQDGWDPSQIGGIFLPALALWRGPG